MTDVNLLAEKLENIQVQTNSSIALVIIEREKNLNTLNSQTISELTRIFRLIKENSEIKVAILASSGEKAFISGTETQELTNLTPQEAKIYAEKGQKLALEIENLGKPVIAAINGLTFDVGLEIALACSLRIATSDSQFGFPAIEKGLLPFLGGSRRLARLIGVGRALELLLSARILDAQEAYKMGLISQVTRQTELFSQVKTLAQKISNNSPLAIKYLLESFFNGLEMPLEDALLLESTLFGLSTKSFNNKSIN
ncbi:MAG: enoyl-CoA hydratase/isomerase family protein [Acidobacteria bacterium]|nr:enoyl-CoA hydratase/isomerase family protein [Acidobacteriota bacterium]